MIDHLLWAVPDLADGCRQMHTRAGVEPTPGGRHPGVGTHNALLSLGSGRYLEIIAPDPTQDHFTGLGTFLEHLETPTLLTWCAATNNIDTLAATAHTAGLTHSKPFPMSRRRPDGVQLRWRILLLDAHDLGLAVPFFIQWDTPHHPSASAPEGCHLKNFELQHPAASTLAECLETLGLEVEVVKAAKPGLRAMLGSPQGDLMLGPATGSDQ